MRPVTLIAIGCAVCGVLVSGARADDGRRADRPDNEKTAPACCNPAAANKWVKRPPGVYVGMPLRPGDIGYKGNMQK